MPQDTAFDAYFASGPTAVAYCAAPKIDLRRSGVLRGHVFRDSDCMLADGPPPPRRAKRNALRSCGAPPPATTGPDDLLMDLAARLEPDGGMPGGSDSERLLTSLLALLFFAETGHTPSQGAFRDHVRRLIEYVENSIRPATARSAPTPQQTRMIESLLSKIRQGNRLPGDRAVMVRDFLAKGQVPSDALWSELEILGETCT